ncbi:TPR repeat-containing protein [Cryptosporidium felis]|nr:TPR repeat-containing protein [Cryptosporidium felis]
MEELTVRDYIDICKEAGNYRQAIFWCDVASAQESEEVGDGESSGEGFLDDFVDLNGDVKISPKLRGAKSVEYLLEMAALYMLDGKDVCVDSVLKRIYPDDLEKTEFEEDLENKPFRFVENSENSCSFGPSQGIQRKALEEEIAESLPNSLLSRKLLLEAQYLHSMHRYEECLSLIESSIDLSSFDAFTSSSIHTLAAESFSSIGNIEYANMLYETALYESHHSVEALDYLLQLPYYSESAKQALLANIIGSPIDERDKAWLRNYLNVFHNVGRPGPETGSSIFRSASPSVSPNRKREKRLLPTSPINVASRISADNPDKVAFRNYYTGAPDGCKTQEDLGILRRIAFDAKTELGLRLVSIYIYKFVCQSNLTCGYLLGSFVWNQFFGDSSGIAGSPQDCEQRASLGPGGPISVQFNDNYKSLNYSTPALCEFINMFSLCIVSKLYTEVSICQATAPKELRDYLTLLESFVVILEYYGGDSGMVKKNSKDGSLTFSAKLFNSKLFGKNSDDICCGINFNGNNLGNGPSCSNENGSSGSDSWFKKLFPYNVTASSFFFAKACFLFTSAIGKIHSSQEDPVQTVRSLLRTSMYFLKRSINFNYVMLPSYYLWGNIYTILGQWDDAIVIFRRIIRLFPSTTLSVSSATSLLLQRVQLEKEVQVSDLLCQCTGWATKGLQINKDTPSIHNSLGICAYYEKKYDIAIGYFQKAFNCFSSQQPEQAEAHHPGGSSSSSFSQALFRNPGRPDFNSSLFSFNQLPFVISVNLALSYLMGGHYQNAIDCLKLLFASKRYFHQAFFEPTFLQYIYVILGISHHLLDNIKEACNYYELFLSLPFEDFILDELEEFPNSETLNSSRVPGNDAVQMLVFGDHNSYMSKVFIKNISELYNSIMLST